MRYPRDLDLSGAHNFVVLKMTAKMSCPFRLLRFPVASAVVVLVLAVTVVLAVVATVALAVALAVIMGIGGC